MSPFFLSYDWCAVLVHVYRLCLMSKYTWGKHESCVHERLTDAAIARNCVTKEDPDDGYKRSAVNNNQLSGNCSSPFIFVSHVTRLEQGIHAIIDLFLLSSPVFIFVYVCGTGLFTMMTVSIMRIPSLDVTDVADALDWVFLILFPHYSLGTAFSNLYINKLTTDYCSNVTLGICELFNRSGIINPCCKGKKKN